MSSICICLLLFTDTSVGQFLQHYELHMPVATMMNTNLKQPRVAYVVSHDLVKVCSSMWLRTRKK